jgi:hypothetical protein
VLASAYGVGIWALMRYVLLPFGVVYLLFGERRLAGESAAYQPGRRRMLHLHKAA